ncbi:MAG: radical SAM protein [Planctomycetaceae bacterium]|jgi:2-iminoacetate synthase|nr:radical SAM protein [Planctomycetaceae bacterium]
MNSALGIEETARHLISEETPLQTVMEESQRLTARHFSSQQNNSHTETNGKHWRMQLYAPIYVSSFCVNQCLYCGFRAPHSIQRKHLSVEETVGESQYLLQRGFKSQLIVAGESPKVSSAYLAEIMRRLRSMQVVPSIEVAPASVEQYAEIVAGGCRGITLFQETFDRTLYAKYHPAGPKSDYEWRVRALERAAEAGMPRIGYGVLLGLAEPRRELIAMMEHAAKLTAKYPDRIFAFSLPRIHEGPNGFAIPYQVSDELFVRMYCALRIIFPKAELVLSTRETPELRNQLASLCITQISAESSTEPGGYAINASQNSCAAKQSDDNFHGQFLVADCRSAQEIADWLTQYGHDVRW